MRIILWNFLTWFWIAGGSSVGIRKCALSIYGERPIVVQTYWQREVLLIRQGKCCMIHAPPFCCNVYIGTSWALSHPGVVAVNKTPIMLCCPLFLLVLVCCVLFVGLCFLSCLYIAVVLCPVGLL